MFGPGCRRGDCLGPERGTRSGVAGRDTGESARQRHLVHYGRRHLADPVPDLSVCLNGTVEDSNARKSRLDALTDPNRPVMRTLTLVGVTVGVIGGLIASVIGVLTYRASEDHSVTPKPPTSSGTTQDGGAPKASPSGLSPLEEVAALSTGVQLRKFVDLLGQPDRKREVLNPDAKPTTDNESIWQRPAYVLQAITNADQTVELYTVTTMDKNFHPEIPFKMGKSSTSIRLGLSKFADIEPSFLGLDGIYPANAKYIYSEAYGKGAAFQSRTIFLTQSWDATGIAPFDSSSGPQSLFDDFGIATNACRSYDPCGPLPQREATALQRLRASLVISGFTITEPDFDTKSIIILPNPDILSSRCELPVGCN